MTKGERKILKHIRESLLLATNHASNMGFQEYDTSNERSREEILGELEHSLRLVKMLEEVE